MIRILHISNPMFGGDAIAPDITELRDAHKELHGRVGIRGADWLDPAEGHLESVVPQMTAAKAMELVVATKTALENEDDQMAVVLTGRIAAHGQPAHEKEVTDFIDQAAACGVRTVVAAERGYADALKTTLERLKKLGVSAQLTCRVDNALAKLASPREPLPGGVDLSHPANGQKIWRVAICRTGHSLESDPRTVNVVAKAAQPTMEELEKLQENYGIDLVLHGRRGKVQLDADLKTAGHLYSLGAYMEGVPAAQAIDFDNSYAATRRLLVDPQSGKYKLKATPDNAPKLLFERERPDDEKTWSTRLQLRKYLVEGLAKEWKKVEEPIKEAENHFFFVGRTLGSVPISVLKTILDNERSRVRLLCSNPRLLDGWLRLDPGELVPQAVRNDFGTMLGNKKELYDDIQGADEALRKLQRFIGDLDARQRARIDMRVSHSVVPIAGTARIVHRNNHEQQGKLMVRLLPLHAIKERYKVPHMLLERRTQPTLFDHYLSTFQYLVARGRKVLGDWPAGNNKDLGTRHEDDTAEPLKIEDVLLKSPN